MPIQAQTTAHDAATPRMRADGTDTATALVRHALQVEPVALVPQLLTQSGNTIHRVELADGRTVVLRVSPQPAAFAHTTPNLDVLRALGLPVQQVLAAGPAALDQSFVILNWLDGFDLKFALPAMRADQMAAVAERVADCQRRVAGLPASRGFGWAPIGRDATHARWTDLFGAPAAAPVAVEATPLNHLRARLRAVRATLEPYFSACTPVCFLDDLTTRNVIVDNGVLTGFIDLDFVCYGDPLLQVGTTLAYLAADVGDAGRAYGDALVDCWSPRGDARRAMYFYAGLWATGFLAAAETAGDAWRIRVLEPAARALLDAAEAC
jgi:aminoglycoside phosphotransferase (APT) family kinase protein